MIVFVTFAPVQPHRDETQGTVLLRVLENTIDKTASIKYPVSGISDNSIFLTLTLIQIRYGQLDNEYVYYIP